MEVELGFLAEMETILSFQRAVEDLPLGLGLTSSVYFEGLPENSCSASDGSVSLEGSEGIKTPRSTTLSWVLGNPEC